MKTYLQNKSRLIFLFIILTAILAARGSAETIGKGSAQIFNKNEQAARDQAKRNALRDAVEKGVGLILDSKTITKNWAVIRDEVYSSARGFVTKYDVIQDEKQGNTWYFEIDATVATGSIKDKLQDLRILHKKMGNKRLMVIYRKNQSDALDPDDGAVLEALSAIQTELNQAGFRVFDQQSVANLYSRINPSGNGDKDVEQWIKIANEQHAEILLQFELTADRKRSGAQTRFSAARAGIQIRTFDVSTGRLISNNGTVEKQMTNARIGSSDWKRALSSASKKAGKVAATETIDQIVSFYQNVGDIGNAFFVIFKNYTEDEEDSLMEQLEELEGYQSITELKNQPMLLEVEYFSSLKKSQLRRKLRIKAKENGIRLTTREISGNRLLFEKRLEE